MLLARFISSSSDLIANFKSQAKSVQVKTLWNLLKGPLKYLLRPLLGKNQVAVTQRTYARIGPNLDNIY